MGLSHMNPRLNGYSCLGILTIDSQALLPRPTTPAIPMFINILFIVYICSSSCSSLFLCSCSFFVYDAHMSLFMFVYTFMLVYMFVYIFVYRSCAMCINVHVHVQYIVTRLYNVQCTCSMFMNVVYIFMYAVLHMFVSIVRLLHMFVYMFVYVFMYMFVYVSKYIHIRVKFIASSCTIVHVRKYAL